MWPYLPAGREQDDRIGDPESTIGRKHSRTKRVTYTKLPHARKELGETAKGKGHAHDHVRLDSESNNLNTHARVRKVWKYLRR